MDNAGCVEDTAEEVTRRGGTGIPVLCDHTNVDQVCFNPPGPVWFMSTMAVAQATIVPHIGCCPATCFTNRGEHRTYVNL